MNTNIEYKDFEDQTVQRVNEARKIKFKQSSFSVIYNTFKDFIKRKLVNIVDSKLEKAKNDLVNVEFKRGDNLVNYDGTTNKEKIITKKAKAIDRLDKILKFLERGNYKNLSSTSIEEDSRPLRIKNEMEKALRSNIGSVEKVPEEQKDNLMDSINNELNDTKKVIEEETAKVNEKIEKVKADAPEQEQENFENITVEDVRESVEKSFEEEAKDATHISTEDIKEAVEDQFKEEQPQEEPVEKQDAITYEDVEKIANEQFTAEPEKVTEVTPITNIEKREIGGINALPQEETEDINKGIFNTEEEKKEEPVTTEEEIREVPVVAPEREEDFVKANEEFKEAEEIYDKIMNGTESEEEVTKEVEESDEKIYEETSETTVEEKDDKKKEIPDEENIGFDFSDASIDDMKKAAEVTTSQKDLTAMMLKIKMLKKEEERTKEQIKKAQEEAAAKEAKFQETYKMFDDYCNELEAKCNKNLEEKEAIVNRSKEKDEAINKMLSAMDITEESNSKKKK